MAILAPKGAFRPAVMSRVYNASGRDGRSRSYTSTLNFKEVREGFDP